MVRILNRPLSPHLTVYTSQFTSTFSIWHRITGIVLFFVLISFLILCKIFSFILLSADILKMYFYVSLWVKNCIFLNIMLIIFYHLINGLRYISWDFSNSLSINLVINSAKAILVSLFIFAILLIQKTIS